MDNFGVKEPSIKQQFTIQIEIEGSPDEIWEKYNIIKNSIPEAVAWLPLAVLGNCPDDGSVLRVVSLNGVSHYCCSRTPMHCVKA
ncbi:MAG TPA: hypothetical protein VGC76_12710 [Pyrinomonadaceae bacterium]|jgi:hypothetical protein